ncbi:unnamed protein product, partial [marine sediment metagenome]
MTDTSSIGATGTASGDPTFNNGGTASCAYDGNDNVLWTDRAEYDVFNKT